MWRYPHCVVGRVPRPATGRRRPGAGAGLPHRHGADARSDRDDHRLRRGRPDADLRGDRRHAGIRDPGPQPVAGHRGRPAAGPGGGRGRSSGPRPDGPAGPVVAAGPGRPHRAAPARRPQALRRTRYGVDAQTPATTPRRGVGHPAGEGRPVITVTEDPVLLVGVPATTRRLRAALRANAVFCLLCGVALVAAGGFVAGPSAWAWPGSGPGGVAGGPGGRAAAAVGAAGGGRGHGVAGGQHRPAGRTTRRPGRVWPPSPRWPPPWRVSRSGKPRVWPPLTDHELYGRLAPNLTTVEVISAAGEPLRRRCTNTAGDGWEETCTLWEDGRRFAVDVDTGHYPYPILLMRGLWQVDPHPAGSRVTMRFVYRAQPSVTGGLFAIVFRLLFTLALDRIFRGWRTRLSPQGSR